MNAHKNSFRLIGGIVVVKVSIHPFPVVRLNQFILFEMFDMAVTQHDIDSPVVAVAD